MDLTDDHSVADLFAIKDRDVHVFNEKEGVSAGAIWCIANTNSLAEAAQFVG